MTNIIHDNLDGQIIINALLGKKPCKFILDTDPTVAIIKRDISRNTIFSSNVAARSAIGMKFLISSMCAHHKWEMFFSRMFSSKVKYKV